MSVECIVSYTNTLLLPPPPLAAAASAGMATAVGVAEADMHTIDRLLLEREAARWLAGESEDARPPRMLIGQRPDVGMGNQAVVLGSYLAPARLAGRALCRGDPARPCHSASPEGTVGGSRSRPDPTTPPP